MIGSWDKDVAALFKDPLQEYSACVDVQRCGHSLLHSQLVQSIASVILHLQPQSSTGINARRAIRANRQDSPCTSRSLSWSEKTMCNNGKWSGKWFFTHGSCGRDSPDGQPSGPSASPHRPPSSAVLHFAASVYT